MREVIIGILSTEEIEAETKFSETENGVKVESPFMYRNMGELIRCKDCKHYDSEHEVCCVYVSYRFTKNADDYCSDAERKEE